MAKSLVQIPILAAPLLLIALRILVLVVPIIPKLITDAVSTVPIFVALIIPVIAIPLTLLIAEAMDNALLALLALAEIAPLVKALVQAAHPSRDVAYKQLLVTGIVIVLKHATLIIFPDQRDHHQAHHQEKRPPVFAIHPRGNRIGNSLALFVLLNSLYKEWPIIP